MLSLEYSANTNKSVLLTYKIPMMQNTVNEKAERMHAANPF
jgi:hypothetical protein